MLSDVSAVPERVVELAVPVAPEHVGQRLTNFGASRDRLRKHRVGVGDLQGQNNRCAADRGRGKDVHPSSRAALEWLESDPTPQGGIEQQQGI